jgi:hypothetical protein
MERSARAERNHGREATRGSTLQGVNIKTVWTSCIWSNYSRLKMQIGAEKALEL